VGRHGAGRRGARRAAGAEHRHDARPATAPARDSGGSGRTVLLVFEGTCLMSVGYTMGLYYTPLYFSFSRGDGPIRSAVHMLPLVGTFIACVLLSGALLPRVRRYAAIFAASGCLMVAAGGAFVASVNVGMPDRRVMGITAVLGAGVSMAFPVGISVTSFVLPRARAPDAALLNVLGISVPAAVVVAVAGCIFEDVGMRDLRAVLGPHGFLDAEIREALAGASSRLDGGEADLKVRALAGAAVTRVIARLFYILLTSGVLEIINAACMRWEALDFQGRQKAMMAKAHPPDLTSAQEVSRDSNLRLVELLDQADP
jgi:hypothetical protein